MRFLNVKLDKVSIDWYGHNYVNIDLKKVTAYHKFTEDNGHFVKGSIVVYLGDTKFFLDAESSGSFESYMHMDME